MEEKLQFKIMRQKFQAGIEKGFQTVTVSIDTDSSVLDALEMIRCQQDASLMYRHSCHHSSCGTCGMIINGQERLACVTRVSQLKTRPITLEPLTGFPVMGDLAVDMTCLYEDIDGDWDYLRASEDMGHEKLPEGIGRFERFENCIECGCCFSVCPSTGPGRPFMGPAALACLATELKKFKGNEKVLLGLAGGDRGEKLCERALACSRVCPTEVYPARHILDLRKRLHGQDK
jgi:succinate dehydrogenase / fumarate reductase, iron-sulfur subunit